MQVLSPLARVTLGFSFVLALLPACRQQTPPPPQPSADTPAQVTPSATETRSASDHPEAPPAIGAQTAGQASGGASKRPLQPTAGDGASAPASAASAG